jgi:hypothetical protein
VNRAVLLTIAAATALSACGREPAPDQPVRPQLVSTCMHQVGDLYVDAAGQRWLGVPDLPDTWVRIAASASNHDVCP